MAIRCRCVRIYYMKLHEAHHKKINIILLFLFFLIFVLPSTTAQTPEVVIVETIDVPVVTEFTQAFFKGMDSYGYETGSIQRFNAEGNASTASKIASGLRSGSPPSLVVTVATLASTAVWNELRDTDIPMMFAVVTDPVGAGLVPAIHSVSDDNITGLTATLGKDTQLSYAHMLASQKLENPIRIGIVTSDYPASMSDIQMLKSAAEQYSDLEFMEYVVEYDGSASGIPAMLDEVRHGIISLEDQVDFWWEVSGPLGEIPEYIELLTHESSKPILFGNTIHSVMHGALFSMIPDIQKTGLEAAQIAHSILLGTDPGSIPIRTPSNFILGLNMRSALDQQLVVPAQMLELAGNYIYW